MASQDYINGAFVVIEDATNRENEIVDARDSGLLQFYYITIKSWDECKNECKKLSKYKYINVRSHTGLLSFVNGLTLKMPGIEI